MTDRKTPIHRIISESGVTEDLVRSVIQSFYADVRVDSILGEVFHHAIEDGDWSSHVVKVIRFWLTALRISRCYNGKDFMPAHVKHPQIRPELGPRWLQLFGRSVDRFCSPKQAMAFKSIAAAMMENIEFSLSERDSCR